MKRKGGGPPAGSRTTKPYGVRRERAHTQIGVSDADSELFRRSVGKINPVASPVDYKAARPGLDAFASAAGNDAQGSLGPNQRRARPRQTQANSTASPIAGPPKAGTEAVPKLHTLVAQMSVARHARASAGMAGGQASLRTEQTYSHMGHGLKRKERARLKRGQIRPQADLDLHGMNVPTALEALQRFVNECGTRAMQCVRVIHGKGFGSPGGEARLRPAVAQWLLASPDVIAYCPAQRSDGGAGATYVLLKLKRHAAGALS